MAYEVGYDQEEKEICCPHALAIVPFSQVLDSLLALVYHEIGHDSMLLLKVPQFLSFHGARVANNN